MDGGDLQDRTAEFLTWIEGRTLGTPDVHHGDGSSATDRRIMTGGTGMLVEDRTEAFFDRNWSNKRLATSPEACKLISGKTGRRVTGGWLNGDKLRLCVGRRQTD
jgi:hypothetical protein